MVTENGSTGAAPRPGSSGASLRAAASELLSRYQFAKSNGLSFWDPATGTYKRDLRSALGYREVLTAADYRDRYERGGIAERIVEAYPLATWVAGADVQENADPNTETEFEKSVGELFERLRAWERLQRADILCGLGSYSVLLIGAAARGQSQVDLSQPLERVAGPDDILFLTPLSELKAKITEFDSNPTSPRFGSPSVYELQLYPTPPAGSGSARPAEATTAARVHWSRVIHVTERLFEDEVYGKPRLRAVFDYLDDLSKLVGAGAEAAWKRMDPGLHLDLDPMAQVSQPEQDAIQDQVDEYVHGLRRVLQTRGMEVTPLAAAVAGFGDNADKVLDLIAGTTGIPKRILLGSERGELASTQDRENWNNRVAERRVNFAGPLVRTLIKRLGELGALKVPEHYDVVWPTEEESGEKEKAETASIVAAANQAQMLAEGNIIMTAAEIRDTIWGLEPLEPEEAAGLPPAKPAPVVPTPLPDEEDEGDEMPVAARAAVVRPPAWQHLHRVADDHAARLEEAFRGAFEHARDSVDLGALEQAIRLGDRGQVEQILLGAMRDFGARLDEELPHRITAAALAAGKAD